MADKKPSKRKKTDGNAVPACVPPPGYALVPVGTAGLIWSDGFNIHTLPKPDITDPPPELKWGPNGPFWATPAGLAAPKNGNGKPPVLSDPDMTCPPN